VKKNELLEMFAAQQAQIASLTDVVKSLAATQATVQAAPPPAPAVAPAITAQELYDRYCQAHSGVAWWRRAMVQMQHPIRYFGPMLVTAIRRSHWLEYRDHVRGKMILPNGNSVSIGTMNLELKRLKTIGYWGVAEELIERNPWQGMKTKKHGGRNTVISDDDLVSLLAVANEWMRAMILLAVDSGLRASEARELRWEELDLQRGLVSFPAERTKTRTARSGWVSERALDAIKLYPQLLGCPFVFPNPATGKPYKDTYVRRVFRAACSDAGVRAAPGDVRLHYHDLRHSAVTRMVQAGAHPQTAQRSVGHETAAQNWKYTHLGADDLLKLKRFMDEAIRDGRKGPQRADDEGTSEVLPKKMKNNT
jgi:integrase